MVDSTVCGNTCPCMSLELLEEKAALVGTSLCLQLSKTSLISSSLELVLLLLPSGGRRGKYSL